jgi:PKD repeat protein
VKNFLLDTVNLSGDRRIVNRTFFLECYIDEHSEIYCRNIFEITCKKSGYGITHSINSLLRVSLSVEPSTLKLTAATAAIIVILFAPNVTITNAWQQQQQQQQGLLLLQQLLLQLLTSQPATVENGTTTYQSTNDSFSVQVPQGWIIQDMNNTGFALGVQVLQGFGVLAQLCPEEEEEQQAVLVNTGGNTSNISSSTGGNTSNISSSTSSSSNSCRGAQEVIHVVRYPNLGAGLGFASDDSDATTNNSNITPDTILVYQLQKLQEVGYRDIRIVNSADTTINIISTLFNNNVIATVPAKIVEMTYSTTSTPNETRRGYFLSTATNATPRNLGMTTGYALFYEGNSTAAETTTASSSLPPPAPVIQVFNSVELIAGEEVEQAVVAALRALAAQTVVEEPADVLTVEIDSSATEGDAPLPIEFEADITGGTKPYTISWDLDDDGITESNEQTFVATFNEAGTYDTLLVVTDSEGQTASDTVEITVEEGEGGGKEEASLEEELPTVEKEEKEPLIEETTEEETNQPDLDEPDNNSGSDSLLGLLYGLGWS